MKEETNKSRDLTLVFQDVLHSSEDVSTALFSLANASEISYRIDGPGAGRQIREHDGKIQNKNRIDRKRRRKSELKMGCTITIQQDVSACLQHTGGIVWETSYLLLTYLIELFRQQSNQERLGTRVLELGAGCGLLGQGVGLAMGSQINSRHLEEGITVVLTECREAYDNLAVNIQKNRDILQRQASLVSLECCVLDWLHVERDIEASHGLLQNPFDTIVATDVLFSPKLVLPLLKSMKRLSHQSTTIYLCVQIRCTTSHDLFLEKASDYGLSVSNITESVYKEKGCEWGEEMECLVFHMTPSNYSK